MLPAHQRLTRPAEFSLAVRAGRRAGRPHVVVHVGARHGPSQADPDHGPRSSAAGTDGSGGSARVGLIVSKAVGSAVTRHRVSRKLRGVLAPLVSQLPVGSIVVVRALPPSATASSTVLAADVVSALRRLGVLDQRR